MEIKHDTLQAISKGLRDRAGVQPPIHVTWAVASLAGGDGTPAILRGRREELEDGTVWYALAVTGGVIVTVTASSPAPDWSIGTQATDGSRLKPAKLDARSRRIRDISSLEVIETIGGGAWQEDLTRWSASWRIHFADGGVPFDLHSDTNGESDGIARTIAAGLS